MKNVDNLNEDIVLQMYTMNVGDWKLPDFIFVKKKAMLFFFFFL